MLTYPDNGCIVQDLFWPRVQHVGLPQVPLPCTITLEDNSTPSIAGESCIPVDMSCQSPDQSCSPPQFSESIDNYHMRALFGEYLASVLSQLMLTGNANENITTNSKAPDVVFIDDNDESNDVVPLECVDLTSPKVDRNIIDVTGPDRPQPVTAAVAKPKPPTSVHTDSQSASQQVQIEFAISRQPVKKMTRWMEIWAGKRRRIRKSHKARREGSGRSSRSAGVSIDINEELMNSGISHIMHVVGPSGAGKTAAVHSCAKAAGFKIIEINTAQDRKGSEVRKLVSEACQSYGLGASFGSDETAVASGPECAQTSQLTLILFDEVSAVLYFYRLFCCPLSKVCFGRLILYSKRIAIFMQLSRSCLRILSALLLLHLKPRCRSSDHWIHILLDFTLIRTSN
jgi:hypothetical protein